MDDLYIFENESKLILKKVKSAFKGINQDLIGIQNDLNNSELENDIAEFSPVENGESLIEDRFSEIGPNIKTHSSNSSKSNTKGVDPLHIDDHLANDETKLFDEVSPVKSSSVHRKPNSVIVRSSTPMLEEQQAPVLRKTGGSTKSNDSDGLWSIDSKPIAIGSTKTSVDMDFHLVETVLPARKNSFNINEKISLKDLENDDALSDGSQSHTVFTITKLMASLNEEKKKSKELKENLTLTENELAASKIQFELLEAETHQGDTGKLADLVEEIYRAQKEREHAMIERLKLANKERDEALLRAKAFAKDAKHFSAKENNHEFCSSKSLQELIDVACSADTGRATDRFGREIVSHISNLKVEKERIAKEEMEMVIRERNDALHKCRSACIELHNLKNETAKEEELCRNQKSNLEMGDSERQKMYEKLSKTDQELEALRTYYSLHKSHSKHNESDTIREAEEKGDADRLAHALRIAHEHNNVQAANARRQEVNIRRLRERNDKLERLVTVLRKKVSILAQKSTQQVVESSGHLISRNRM